MAISLYIVAPDRRTSKPHPAREGHPGEIERVAVFKPGTLGTLHLDFYLPKGDLPGYGDQTVLQVLDSVRYGVQRILPPRPPYLPVLPVSMATAAISSPGSNGLARCS